jgi:hypothetical protein
VHSIRHLFDIENFVSSCIFRSLTFKKESWRGQRSYQTRTYCFWWCSSLLRTWICTSPFFVSIHIFISLPILKIITNLVYI